MNRNEGKQMKSETMPKKDAETRNEVRRDTKTNVEERGKTRNEKKKNQDQGRRRQNSGYGLVRRGSYVQGPCRTRG